MAGSSEYKRVIIVRRDPWALALLPLFRHRLVKYIIDFISLKCIFNIFFWFDNHIVVCDYRPALSK